MINAIKYMDDLVETGFTQEQAKTTVSMWMELMNENLATKSELKALELSTEKKIKESELTIIKTLGSLIIIATAFLGLIIKF